ncbi:MAG: hypothetical protein JW822_09155 [Spirochaetales bacterium]|nr:hypothetical protein [Spirochaetales bacterium]
MKNVIKVILLFGNFLLLTAHGFSDGPVSEYKLTIYGGGNEALVTCVFSCQDTNNDGIIEISELKDFKETGKHLYPVTIAGQSGGWRAAVDVKSLPPIIHAIEDVRIFRFSVSEYEKGNSVIDYETKTKNYLRVGAYYFMRIVSIEEHGKKLSVFSWVGDGNQGLELTMRDTKNLTLKIEKQ